MQSVGGTLRTPSATLRNVIPLCRTGQLLDCLNAKSSEERVVYKRLNSTGTLIQRTTTGFRHLNPPFWAETLAIGPNFGPKKPVREGARKHS